jgi:hypothetical protein
VFAGEVKEGSILQITNYTVNNMESSKKLFVVDCKVQQPGSAKSDPDGTWPSQ